jgi:small subunit ribosomal protein S6
MAAPDGGSGGGELRRGQATTAAIRATTPSARATLPQRTRRRRSCLTDPVAAPARSSPPALLPSIAAMAAEPPVYDLVLLLDTATEEARRLTILADVEDAIDRSGEVLSRYDWGVRPTAYEVRKHTDADYHLIQFHGSPELLEQLEHNLKITDGVLRFRIIKLRRGTPPAPDMRPAAVGAGVPDEE